MIKNVVLAVVALVVVVGVAAGAFYGYQQIKARDASIASFQTALAQSRRDVAAAEAQVSSLTQDKADLIAKNETVTGQNANLADELAKSKAQVSDVQSKNATLAGQLSQAQGLVYCTASNPGWVFHSTSEVLGKLDSVGVWDYRISDRTETIWNNSAAQYLYVTAQSGGKSYGFPFLVFPANDSSDRKGSGVWDITQQCWISLVP